MKKLFVIINFGTTELYADSCSDVYNLILEKNEEIEKYRINLFCNNIQINENNFEELEDESTIVILIIESCYCWLCKKNFKVKFFNLDNNFTCLFCIKQNKSKYINDYREITKKDIEKLCVYHSYEKDLICFDCGCFYCVKCSKNHENHKGKSISCINTELNEKKEYLRIIKRNFSSFALKNDIDKIIDNKFNAVLPKEYEIILNKVEFILNDPPKMNFDKQVELKKINENLINKNGYNLKKIFGNIYYLDKLNKQYLNEYYISNSILITLIICRLIDNNYEYKNLLKKIKNEQDKLKNYYIKQELLYIYQIELSREVSEMTRILEEYHNKGYFY